MKEKTWMLISGLLAAALVIVLLTRPNVKPAYAAGPESDFIGSVELLPYPSDRGWSEAPVGWMWCDGQQLNIAQYQALYSLIGITYRGDGATTFNLPKMAPMKTTDGKELKWIICLRGRYPSRL